MDVPEMVTPRLCMRGWTEADVEQLANIYADEESARYIRPYDFAGTRQQIERFKTHWDRHGFGLWAVQHRETGRFIGRIGLMHHDDWTASSHDAEVGWVIARDLWGQGLASEGGAAALEFGKACGLKNFISIAHVGNAASQRVMEKLGFVREGETQWRDSNVVWFSLDR
ncbi:MAG TPA: GNAT family N-acetyltransferase [Candidatus Limnocylindria bacterium]|nr:GNAT family N-acetyltransferase [Candidatus Limnocylindria bacterium]